MLLTDIGLAVVLTVLGALMFWRLWDLFRSKGRWVREVDESPPAKNAPLADTASLADGLGKEVQS
jgi:hypothetical protein